MVAIVNRMLNELVTWWPVSPDGMGGDVFGSPVLCNGRWEDRQETYVGQIDRRELVSKAIVYTDRAVSTGDWLAPGDQTANANPSTAPGAEKIQRYQKFPDLRSLEAMHKSIL